MFIENNKLPRKYWMPRMRISRQINALIALHPIASEAVGRGFNCTPAG
jgi:hypothetical protein